MSLVKETLPVIHSWYCVFGERGQCLLFTPGTVSLVKETLPVFHYWYCFFGERATVALNDTARFFAPGVVSLVKGQQRY